MPETQTFRAVKGEELGGDDSYTQTSKFCCLSGAGTSTQTPVYSCSLGQWHSKAHCPLLFLSTSVSTCLLQEPAAPWLQNLQNLVSEKCR